VKVFDLIRQVVRRLIPTKNIQSAENIETPLSQDMQTALDLWRSMYNDNPPWVDGDSVKSQNLPAFISSEISRQITLEMQWSLTGGQDESGDSVDNARSTYLKAEFERCIDAVIEKLPAGCAAGGMVIKPYPKDGHLYFNIVPAWSVYPVAFGDGGDLVDVIFPDSFSIDRTTYTRLERHKRDGDDIVITQRAFESKTPGQLGTEIPLSRVEQWKDLEPEVKVPGVGGNLYGWYKAHGANSVDDDSPMGMSVFGGATKLIREADIQWSRLLWEYEASEMAIDVDPTALKVRPDGKSDTPRLKDRLFRAVDNGSDGLYSVFAPTIRDASIINGLERALRKIEDACGLSAGTISDVNNEARTATELRIMRQRTYVTISHNQRSLERCLIDVVRAMDFYATLYNLAPAGEYDISFEWDDSITTDTAQQLNERLLLKQQGLYGDVEFRMWYFGETHAQATAALEAIRQEQQDKATATLNLNQLLSQGATEDDNGLGDAKGATGTEGEQ